jgi:hypothetical protein
MRHRDSSTISISTVTEETHLAHHDFLFAVDFTETAKECGVAIGIPGVTLPAGQLVQHQDGC